MSNEQLNKLVADTLLGCTESRDLLFLYFQPFIQRMSNEIWYLLRDETSFEQACYRKVVNAANSFDPMAGRSFRNYVIHKLNGVRNKYLTNTKYLIKAKTHSKNVVSIEALASRDDGTPYEVIDDLAVVDDGLIVNEKIALLAEDDSRKLAILNAWSNGEYNDSDTALFLAKRCGGNSESHRKFINRFRTTCQKALA
jgi:hypothetical protein